ncbi:MAG: molybdopterin-dependent oxidoreductase [Chloroflexi bacterium]|nr:molybdopterin-dependent oxidoreductase [Chloroflexota bacterium]
MSIKELRELPVFPSRTPAYNPSTWRLRVEGLVARPLTLDYAQVRALPAMEEVSPFECVEGWRVPGNRWRGVAIATLLDLACPLPEARFVTFHAGDFVISLALREARQPGVLLAYDLNGASLSPQYGAPIRLVVPARECYFGVKWVERIQLSQEGADTGRSIALGRLQRRAALPTTPPKAED